MTTGNSAAPVTGLWPIVALVRSRGLAGRAPGVDDHTPMADPNIPSIARMRKRHAPKRTAEAGDGRRILAQQSFRDAVFAGFIVVVLFSVLWAMFSTLTNRIFPWMTVVLGILVGLVIRRAGRGLDWRFPLLAALVTLAGAVISNVVVAAAFTARALETSTFEILRAVTAMTWPVFFDEAVTSADVIYALAGAGVAAFFANRRLTRAEFLAVRKWEEAQDHDQSD